MKQATCLARGRATRASGAAGFTLVELLLSTTMAAVVSAAFIGVLVTQIRVAAMSSETTAREETLRLPAVLLATELSLLAPEEDIRFVDRRAIGVRAFRGSGTVCGAAGSVLVRYTGVRQPDPAKDSVLILAADGTRVAALLDSGPAGAVGCSSSNSFNELAWSLTEEASPGDVVLLFESGSYHLVDYAVRYRRGAGGRQPLTPELLDHAGSGLHPYDGGGSVAYDPARISGIELRLVPAPPGDPRTDGVIPTLRRRIPLLNRRGIPTGS